MGNPQYVVDVTVMVNAGTVMDLENNDLRKFMYNSNGMRNSDWIFRVNLIEPTDKYSGITLKVTQSNAYCGSSFRFYTLYFKDKNYFIYKSTKSGLPYKGSCYSRHYTKRSHDNLSIIKNLFNDSCLSQLINSNQKVIKIDKYTIEFIRKINSFFNPYDLERPRTKESLESELKRKIKGKERRLSYFNEKSREASEELRLLELKLRNLNHN
jgi:hypothetical protein